MKCTVCKNEVNEFDSHLLNADGDFACSRECKVKYTKEKDFFFGNIGNDEWYEKYMEKME